MEMHHFLFAVLAEAACVKTVDYYGVCKHSSMIVSSVLRCKNQFNKQLRGHTHTLYKQKSGSAEPLKTLETVLTDCG